MQFLGPQLPSCQSFGITVEPVNATNITHGIPPFYMVAWEIGGTPRTTLLGLNETSLSWTVDHPVGEWRLRLSVLHFPFIISSLWTGASLMLNVVDSQGNGGGVPPQAYTVQCVLCCKPCLRTSLLINFYHSWAKHRVYREFQPKRLHCLRQYYWHRKHLPTIWSKNTWRSSSLQSFSCPVQFSGGH